jgi:hypothetical protein
MPSNRRSLAIAALALTPMLLSGCEKPDPGVTAWSGTTSVRAEAVCWQPDSSAALGSGDCAQDVLDAASAGEGLQTLDVRPGDVVGISVDPVVAESGWSVQAGTQTLVSNLKETYYRFTFPEFGIDLSGPGLIMQVVANGRPTGTRGHWFFHLQPH